MVPILSSAIKNKSDFVGVLASGLCLIHCMATPLIFIAQSCTDLCCNNSPVWWKWVDYAFLIISLAAVYKSNECINKPWIGKALWISWTALFFIILNERMSIFLLPEFTLYLPAIALIFLHIINQKNGCSNESCIQ